MGHCRSPLSALGPVSLGRFGRPAFGSECSSRLWCWRGLSLAPFDDLVGRHMHFHRPTGPGKVIPNSDVPAGGVRAVLANYDIDVDVPKREHITFLDMRVLPILLGRSARVFLQGSASKTGTAAHNLDLSRRRANKVGTYLQSRSVEASRIQID